MKFIIAVLLFFVSCSALAIDPYLNWKTLTTEHFEIHFAEGNDALAARTADIAEQVHRKLSPRLNWQPAEKTHLALSDETDQPNGYAIPFPFNRSVLFLAPPDTTNSLEDFNDWMELLITHEYTHTLHLDKVDGGAKNLRTIFGRHFLLFPNMYQPGWLTEGLATRYETNTAQGIGRGQSSLFSMMMRLEVAQGIKPVRQVNLPIRSWPMGTSYYLYGVYFYEFLSENYGEDTVQALFSNYSNNIIPFMINTNTEYLLNKDIAQLWSEFDLWLQAKYLPQIEQLQKQGIIAGDRITHDGYFTAELATTPDGAVFYVRHGAFDHTWLMMIDQHGIQHTVTEVHDGARIDVNANHDVLIAQPEICNEYNLYYDLYLYKNETGKLKRLTKCGRYRSATWLDDNNIVAVHINQSVSSLHKINILTNDTETLWQGDATTVIGQPDISPDATTLVAAVFRKHHGWNIELFDLNTRSWQQVTDDPVVDMHPRFIADGTGLLFSSERNSVYNIYRYDMASHSISALTHVLNGAFQPAQHTIHSPLYYTGYSAEGNDIYKLTQPVALTSEKLKPVIATPEQNAADISPVIPSSAYSPWPSLEPRWWSPYLTLTEDQSEYGFITAGNDALGIHNYSLILAWDTTNDWAIGSFAYAWSNRYIFGAQRETDILLYNNEFAAARFNDDAYVIANFPYLQVESSWNMALAAISSRGSEASRADFIMPTPDTYDNLLGFSIAFNNSQHYIRSISANDGRTVHLIAESSDVFNSDYSGEVYTLDWREYLPLGGQHVLAIRLAAGYGTDEPEPFRLGGEDSDFELLDLLDGTGSVTFGKREYALRGYAEGHAELSGRRMQLTSLEWRFPLAFVERGYMAPPVALMQLSGSIFADSGRAWQDTAGDAYSSVGAELHGDINLFYGLTFNLRLGYAKGLDDVIGDDRVYLSIGSAF